MGLRALRAGLLIVLLASGCVFVPIPEQRTAGPHPGSRTNITEQPPRNIVIGQTTRTEVLLMLGEPDGSGLQEEWFTYGSVAERGGLHWADVWVGFGFGGGPLDNWDTSRRLTVRFDARGIVSDVAVDQKNCNASERDCLQVRGGDLAEADARAAALAAAGTVIATYKDFELLGPLRHGCGSHPLGANLEMDGPLTLGERGLVWQSQTKRWVNLSFTDVRSVSPPARRGLATWVAFEKNDGSCLYFRIRDKGVSQEDFWSALPTHVPAPATPTPGGTSR